MPNFISEDDIEKAILQRFEQLGFELLNCYTADADNLNDGSQRADKRDEKRVPEVLIQNENLSDEFYQIIEDENLNDAQRAKLERKFATEDFYEALINFTENLKVESERHIREGLSEDELEIFDLLKKDVMTAAETQKVKLAAKSLLHRLIEEHPKVLVQDWYRDALGQNQVKSTVEYILDQNLPESYDKVLFKTKCNTIYDLVYTYASRGQKWAA